MQVLWRGGRLDHGERSKRENERERERQRKNQHAGDCIRKTLPQNHWLGKGEELTTSFYKQQSSKSEVLEVHATTGVMPGGFSSAPFGKAFRDLGVGSMV